MRCMTLAIIFSAIGWIALASNSNAFETLELPPLTAETSAVNLSSSSSSRPHYVVLTGNQTRSEISSSEISSATEMTVPQPQAMKANNSNPPPSFAGNDPGSYHGYRPPMPFGPSSTPNLVQLMNCDPFSCPNIWQGWEAQRAADLAKKCTLPCSGHCGAGRCGNGCGCGRATLHDTPCNTSGSGPARPVNRYRSAPSRSCSSCGKAVCDTLLGNSSESSSSCPACQASQTNANQDQYSAKPSTTTMTR